jgi:Mg2+/Co2+ transporter CorC
MKATQKSIALAAALLAGILSSASAVTSAAPYNVLFIAVDDLNERFGTAAEPEYDTVGGLVLEVAGHIPVVGESVEIDGVRLTVEHLEGNRIRQLVVQPAAAEDEGD